MSAEYPVQNTDIYYPDNQKKIELEKNLINTIHSLNNSIYVLNNLKTFQEYIASITPNRHTSQTLDHIEKALSLISLLKEKENLINTKTSELYLIQEDSKYSTPLTHNISLQSTICDLKIEKKEIYKNLEIEIEKTTLPELTRVMKIWSDDIFNSKLTSLKNELEKTKNSLQKAEEHEQNKLLENKNIDEKLQQIEYLSQQTKTNVDQLEKCLSEMSHQTNSLKQHYTNTDPGIAFNCFCGGLIMGGLTAFVLNNFPQPHTSKIH